MGKQLTTKERIKRRRKRHKLGSKKELKGLLTCWPQQQLRLSHQQILILLNLTQKRLRNQTLHSRSTMTANLLLTKMILMMINQRSAGLQDWILILTRKLSTPWHPARNASSVAKLEV